MPSSSSIPVHTGILPLRTLRREATLSGRTIGFIPTMGALHQGHLSLMLHAARFHQLLVVSIFVNPAQFAPHEDLASYPRTLDDDMRKLEELNAQLSKEDPTGTTLGRISCVFHPTPNILYPRGIPLDQSQQKGAFVSVDPLSQRLEGVTRPHFFRGVATVCTKLFNIIQPDSAYFGQKDVQQTVVLKTLVEDLHINTSIVVVPIVRDLADGLALSSRNVYLGDIRRQYAGCLYAALRAAEQQYENGILNRGCGAEVRNIIQAAESALRPYINDKKVEIDYISLADGKNLDEFRLDEIVSEEKGTGAVLSAAIRMLPVNASQGMVRLIDNIIFRSARGMAMVN